jgi:hypothetical protein
MTQIKLENNGNKAESTQLIFDSSQRRTTRIRLIMGERVDKKGCDR